MSASRKKKLRKEQENELLTQRQKQTKKDAKKLRTQTVLFILVIALVFTSVLGVLAWKGIKNSGILQKNITALTVGNHEINTVMLNYFYMDAISNQYSSWQQSFSTYTDQYLAQYFGLDTTKALNKQYYNEAEKITWADYFTQVAINDAKSCYAIFDKAVAAKYTLQGEALDEYNGWISNYEMQAKLYSTNVNDVVKSNYGPGSDFNSLKDYLKVLITSQAFAQDYADSLTYENEDLRKHEEGREHEFNSYSFATYHLSYTKYPSLGTTDANNKTTFTDAQKKAALEAAKKDAESLVAGLEAVKIDPSKLPEVKEDEDPYLKKFDELIAGLKCNEGNKSAIATKAEDQPYADLNENLKEWLGDPARKEGDTTVIANVSTTKNDDGTETKVTNGYFAIYFTGKDDNSRPLANVRHLLVKFEGGKTDAEGNTTYNDTEKTVAKKEAEEFLADWEKNGKTEEYFIELVKKYSDDTSAEEGGLFEDISPESNYVEEFLEWSLDDSRKAGDAGIIETQYGYHVMYYVGDDEVTYRDQMITDQLKDAAYTEWYNSIVDVVTVKEGNTLFLRRDFIMATTLSSSSLY